MLAAYDYKNPTEGKELVANGAQLRPFVDHEDFFPFEASDSIKM